MGKRARKSKRRLNSLMLSLLLTTILMIVTTYAWFSANRIVSLTGITAKVRAAEGLQISLDGENWSNTFEVNGDVLADLVDTSNNPLNNYQYPTELDPVSSDGTIGVTGSDTDADLTFAYGLLNNTGDALTGIESAAANVGANGKYIAFDIYLKNSSSQGADKYQLYDGSSLAIGENGVASTGLENSARVGIYLYGASTAMNSAPSIIRGLTAGGTTTATLGTGASATEITIPDLVAIWEPNASSHISEVLTNDSRVSADDTTPFKTLALTRGTVGQATLTNINASTIPTGSTYFAIPNTIQTNGSISTSGAGIDLTDVSASQTQLYLAGNAIMKARVYIWLEGQDPDCNDTASTGKEITVNLYFAKPALSGSSTPATPEPDPDPEP